MKFCKTMPAENRKHEMRLDRTTRRELRKLGGEAQRLWDEQRDVLGHARDVVRDASRSAGSFAKREVFPRAHDTYREAVVPLLAKVSKSAPARTKSPGAFSYVLMAIGALAVAAIGYATWQTLREDEDLWVSEESE